MKGTFVKVVIVSGSLAGFCFSSVAIADNLSRNQESGMFEIGGEPSSLSTGHSHSKIDSRTDTRARNGSESSVRDSAESRKDDARSEEIRAQWKGTEATDSSATLTGKLGAGSPPVTDESWSNASKNVKNRSGNSKNVESRSKTPRSEELRRQWKGSEATDTSATLTGKLGAGSPPVTDESWSNSGSADAMKNTDHKH